jgi:hypothetical protein
MSRSKSRRAEDAATFLFLALLSEIRLCIFEIKSDESGSRTQNQAFETAACGKFLFWCCSSAGIRMHRVQLMLHGRANRRTRSRLLPSDAGSKRHGHGVQMWPLPGKPRYLEHLPLYLFDLFGLVYSPCVCYLHPHVLLRARTRAGTYAGTRMHAQVCRCVHVCVYARTRICTHTLALSFACMFMLLQAEEITRMMHSLVRTRSTGPEQPSMPLLTQSSDVSLAQSVADVKRQSEEMRADIDNIKQQTAEILKVLSA